MGGPEMQKKAPQRGPGSTVLHRRAARAADGFSTMHDLCLLGDAGEQLIAPRPSQSRPMIGSVGERLRPHLCTDPLFAAVLLRNPNDQSLCFVTLTKVSRILVIQSPRGLPRLPSNQAPCRDGALTLGSTTLYHSVPFREAFAHHLRPSLQLPIDSSRTLVDLSIARP